MRNRIVKELEKIKAEGLYRVLPPTADGYGKYITYGGKRLLNLASNNYLGISENEEIKKAAMDAINQHGCSSGASRLVTGNYSIYDKLEKETAEFKNTESCLIFNSGFTANTATIASLANRHTVVFSDKLNHASIIDGILLSGAEHIRYRHNDMIHLEKLLDEKKDSKDKIIITDSVFSMDGDKAELAEIVRLAKKYGALTIIDEAHATGIFGGGRGLAHELGLADKIDVNMGTFSKALGSFGAYVAGDKDIIDYIRNKGRAFIFTTALPPAVIGANLGALEWLRKNPDCGHELLAKSAIVRDSINEMGFDTAGSITHIIPVLIGDNQNVLKAGKLLEDEGLKVGTIRPPTVPSGTARLRLSMRLDITDKETETIISALRRLKDV